MSVYPSVYPARRVSAASKAALATAIVTVLALGAGLVAKSWFAIGKPAAAATTLRLGPRTLEIATAALVQDSLGAPEARIGVALAWPTMTPAARIVRGDDGRPAASSLAGTVLVTLTQADDATDPSLRPTLLYGRFLEPTVWNYSGDLIARRFRAGSPYAGEELVLMPPEGRAFAARCPVEVPGAEPRCTLVWRRKGLDITVNFDRNLLMEAPALRERVLTWFERVVR